MWFPRITSTYHPVPVHASCEGSSHYSQQQYSRSGRKASSKSSRLLLACPIPKITWIESVHAKAGPSPLGAPGPFIPVSPILPHGKVQPHRRLHAILSCHPAPLLCQNRVSNGTKAKYLLFHKSRACINAPPRSPRWKTPAWVTVPIYIASFSVFTQ